MVRAPRRSPLPFLCVGHAYDHMFMLLYPTVVLALESEMNRPYGELLALSTAGFILFGAAAPLAGWLADRWSAVGMMTVFFVGIGLATMATGLADTPLMLAVGLGLIGLFAAIYHPVGIAMIIQTAGERRGRNLGISGIAGSFGMGSAALVAGALTDLFTWRAAFLVPGAVSVATGIWFAFAFRHGIAVVIDDKPKERPTGGRRAFVRTMAVLAVMTICAGTVFQATTVGLPKVIDLRVAFFDRNALLIGGAVSVILLLGGVAQFAGGWLADRYRLKPLYLCVYGGMVPALLLAAEATGMAMLALALLMIAIAVGNQPIADNLFSRFIPPKWLSTAFGLRFSLSLGASALAVPGVGLAYDRTGDFTVLFLALAVFAAGVVAAVLFLPADVPGDVERGAKPAAEPAGAAAGGG